MVVRTNQLPVIFDFMKYTKHVATLLNNDYVVLAKSKLQNYKSIIGNKSVDIKIVEKIVSLENFILLSSQSDLIGFDQPPFPKKISPRSLRIIAISIILGFIIGILFVIIRNAIINRNERLIKD